MQDKDNQPVDYEEEEEKEIDPLENPNWKLYGLKSPIHTTIKFKDEFMNVTQDEYLAKQLKTKLSITDHILNDYAAAIKTGSISKRI